MDGSKTTLERAFELARSGTSPDITQLRAKLKQEGYPVEQIDGQSLLKQLRQVIAESKVTR